MTKGGHHVAIIGLADRPTILADYTTDPAQAVQGRRAAFSRSPAAARRCSMPSTTPRAACRSAMRERRVMLVITTEGTDFSTPNHQRALESIKASGASFNALVITRRGGEDLTTDEARSRGIVLDQGPRMSGGRYAQLLSSMSLKGELDQVATDLENQYHVVYARPASLVPPEKIRGHREAARSDRPRHARRPCGRPGGGSVRMPRAFFWPGVLVVAGLLALPGTVAVSGQQPQSPPSGARVRQPPTAPAPSAPRHRRRATRSRPPAQRPSFRAGVELVSLNVTVTDPHGHYLTELDQRDFQVFEDGAQQQVTFFNRSNLPIALSILLDTSASMESKLETAQEAAIGFVRAPAPAGSGAGDRLRQPRAGHSGLHEQCRRSRGRDPSHQPGRLHVAAQRDLHRTEGAEADAGARHGRHPAAGDRRALRRRGHVEPGQLRRGAGSRQAVGDGDLRDWPARRATSAAAASARRSSCCASSRSRPAAACSSRGRSRSWRASTARSPTSCPASTRSATRRAIPKRDGAWRRIVVRVTAPNASARAKQGYYAPTS